MDNPVVLAVAGRLQAAGVATLRFNFRGVGGSGRCYSGGAGEVADVIAAVDYIRGFPALTDLTLAGYSFGAVMALRAGTDRPGNASGAGITRLVAIAPPLSMLDFDGLAACRRPMLFLVGDRDQFCPFADLEKGLAELGSPKLVRVAGADHFFSGHEDAIAEAVAQFVTEPLPT